MDANGQRFWLMADARHWRWRSHTQWDAGCGALRLASERSLPDPADPAAAHAAANTALERVPRTVDQVASVAYWNSAAGAVVARSELPGEAVRIPLTQAPTDLVVGHDDILYAVVAGGVHMHDLRGRWGDVSVEAEGFTPWRAVADPRGGLWVLDRAGARLARLTGRPLTLGPYRDHAGTTFRPDPENCHPPTLTPLPAPAWPSGERPLALAWHPERGLTVLSWATADGGARVRFWEERTQKLGEALELSGARYAYAVSWVDSDRVVVRVPGRTDAPAFALSAVDAQGRIRPGGEVYPLAGDALGAPFAHRLSGAPRYPVVLAGGSRGVEPLHPLSLTNLAQHGEARHFTEDGAHLVDSEDQQTVWHRLYAESRIPAGTGFIVWCAATADAEPPSADDRDEWHPHCFGDVPDREQHAPFAVWEHAPSELSHHPGLGRWPRQAHRAGLWSVLIQTPRRRVRRLVGRYLWMRVELFGDGRVGPEIAAIRAWASRFSYRDQYLPRLYREHEHGAAALAPGELQSTSADFLERFLASFEGVLTPMEDRIADAHLLTDPATVPEPQLDWLGAWIGVAYDPALPEDRRRAWLAKAPDMARFHGTRRGLELALDVASDGGVAGGEIVVIEDFRLRRLLATLLGVDLNVEDDPLLPGLVISGNSVVGDTLTLSEAERVELLALFRQEVATERENQAVLAFYERLAHRATVLVHDSVGPSDLGLLRRIVQLESPAHAEVRVVTATWPLLVGVSSLVGVDTYLGPRPRREPARVDVSAAGRDYVLGPATLDPRLAGSTAPPPGEPPVADAGEDFTTPFGSSFDLDGSGSSAAPGSHIDRYRWRRLPPS